MSTHTGIQALDLAELESRRTGDDRRAAVERRRSAKGLFELRAKREGIAFDRRQNERRDERGGRTWFAFWRRYKR